MMKHKILIFGLGSIGKRHARLLQERFPFELTAFRTYRGQEKNDLGIPEITSWNEAERLAIDTAFITNPTSLHLETAKECVQRKMNLFIEKPVAASAQYLEEVLEAVKKNKLTTYVAYPFRHHQLIRKMKEELAGKKILHARIVCASYMPEWRSKQNHAVSYSSYRNSGGGVLLDLSHELDYADFLFGEIKEIAGHFGKASQVTVDSEDFADLILSHAGHKTSVNLNYFSRAVQRRVQVDTEDGYYEADLKDNTFTAVRGGHSETQQYSIERDEMFRNQLDYFFNHIGDTQMENNLEEASVLFKKILKFKESHEYSDYRLR